MRKFTFCCLILIIAIAVSCKNQSRNSKEKKDAKTTKDNSKKQDAGHPIDSIGLTYFRDLMGKYPTQIKLFDKPELAARLKKMMGNEFDFLKQNWETEVPIEISNGIAFSWGTQAHSGGDPGFALCADISRNLLYTGVRKGGNTQVYAEDKQTLPAQLEDWLKGGE